MRIAALVVVLSACGYDWSVVPKADGGAAPIPCSGKGQCPENTFCSYPDHLCGEGASGTCKPVPTVISCDNADIEIVCTCAGNVWKTRCAASANAEDLALRTSCPDAPAASARCGFLFCDAKSSCRQQEVDGGVDYHCVP